MKKISIKAKEHQGIAKCAAMFNTVLKFKIESQ